jgi:glutamine amidotransferase
VSALANIDSGGANKYSLLYALRRLGCEATLTRDAGSIRQAQRVILPGVGAAADAMQRLRRHGLVEVIRNLQQPLLGICLGMQLLFESSEEGPAECLGIIPGKAQRFCGKPRRSVPHMGWNQLQSLTTSPLLSGIHDGDYAYFVHSYLLPVGPHTIAVTDYDDAFTAAVGSGNFFGTQFHPERSGRLGSLLLQNFLERC